MLPPDYLRYGRQMIVPDFGLPAQLALSQASILIVGAGGLGCPAIAYLAAAGVGSLTILDGDTIELSNLHRQILHSTSSIGTNKALSAKLYVHQLNPSINVTAIQSHLSTHNIASLFSPDSPKFSLILDCSDNPATRYLVNDAAVLSNTPLVSASALTTEGQLAVYNHNNGPCYRCIHPLPPPPSSVVACGDGGILGPVVGIMGVYQALEAIKIITNISPPHPPSLLLFSALAFPPWRAARLRPKQPSCKVCGSTPEISLEKLLSGQIDYPAFCGAPSLLSNPHRISPSQYSSLSTPHTLIDVRPPAHFSICSLPNSQNIPWSDLHSMSKDQLQNLTLDSPIYVVCRRGNDSQKAVLHIRSLLQRNDVWDIAGGLEAWSREVDDQLPLY